MTTDEQVAELRQQVNHLKVQVKALENYLSVQIETCGKPEEIPCANVNLVKNETARWFDIRPAVLYSRARDQHIVFPRMVAMTLACEFCGLSTIAVGRAFGRDHVTVMNAKRRVADRYQTERAVKMNIDGLRNRILERIAK